jgi:predicted acylesterase/phospholipase RssA
MTEFEPRRSRDDLPFRRIALVLSGGGALGAYEVGVLRVLETAALRPAIMVGVSVGAINAVLWLAHGFRTVPLERVWAGLRASSVGMHWITLLVRALGAAIMTVAAIQTVLMLMGSPALSPHAIFVRALPERPEVVGAVLDTLAWLLVGLTGALIVRGSRRSEEWFARLSPPRDTMRLHRVFGVLLAVGLALHLATWATGIPWPHRFSATVLLVGAVIWFANRPGRTGDRLRRMMLRVAPETHGRGLWGSDARRRLIQRIVAEGDSAALTDPDTHLIISACAIGTGDMLYFVNWPNPSPEFRERIAHAVGQVVPLATPDEIIEATVASSAVPPVFEPVKLAGQELVDGGVFSNQPLHAALADDADAMVVVLVSPSGGPPQPGHEPHLLELGGRLLEIANWRNLQTELRALPHGWSREPRSGAAAGSQVPARVCVVEPEETLPGGMYGFSEAHSAELLRRGTRDAWRALAAAGWLAPARAPEPLAAPERTAPRA